MRQDVSTRNDEVEGRGSPLGEGVTHDGVDDSALRRAHLRELTMARQVAERRGARPLGHGNLDRPAQLDAARERAVVLRAEMARIDAAHQAWLQDQGQDVPAPRTRRARAPLAEQP